MLSLSLDHVRTVLCLGAHADDIEIGCGGAVLDLLARQPGKIAVHWVVLSGDDARRAEARRAAEAFLTEASARNVVTQTFRDSYFPFIGGEIKQFIAELRDQISPDLIFTHRRDDLHQDHRLVAELTWCAFRDHLILEYEIPKYEGDLGRPNLFMPLDESVCRRKIDLLIESFPTQRSRPWFTADTFWALLRLRGLECNSPSRYAEAFTCVKMRVGAA